VGDTGGNEEADRTAKEASVTPLTGPELVLGVPKCLARGVNRTWTIDQHHRYWWDVPGHKHGKLFISGPCKKRAEDLLKLSRHQLRMVVVILTGHASVRIHLRTAGLFEGEPVCRLCGQQAETVQHIICRCEATVRRWINP
jgi:hypothetical protein